MNAGGAVAVDELLSKELFKQLCFQEDDDFDDEINGIRCHAIVETPELIQTSLMKLAFELDNNAVIPLNEKKAYLLSQNDDELSGGGGTTSYINQIDFRLRFLRCELFDIKKAAKKMIKFLNIGLELYGEIILSRPPEFKDFSTIEKVEFRKGLYQLLPFRSEGIGRRILFINVGCDEWDTIDSKIRDKILFYITYIAGRDVNMQREGLVIVSWLDSDFKISNHSVVNLLSVRLSAIHICTNDIPYHGLPRSVVAMMIAQNRSLIKLHAGDADDLRSILKGYLGSVSDYIPVTDTGNIKQNYFRKQYKMFNLIEQGKPEETKKWIECPSLTDVLFHQGKSLSHTPGNTKLLELVASEIGGSNKRSSILQIISEIKLNGIFLTHNEKGWWDEIDEYETYKRIDYIFNNQSRPDKKKVQKYYQNQLMSDTNAAANAAANTAADKKNLEKYYENELMSDSTCSGITNASGWAAYIIRQNKKPKY